eukprot:scaffold22355_cov57-Cyclotella_meneghiniana.AAC.4
MKKKAHLLQGAASLVKVRSFTCGAGEVGMVYAMVGIIQEWQRRGGDKTWGIKAARNQWVFRGSCAPFSLV